MPVKEHSLWEPEFRASEVTRLPNNKSHAGANTQVSILIPISLLKQRHLQSSLLPEASSAIGPVKPILMFSEFFCLVCGIYKQFWYHFIYLITLKGRQRYSLSDARAIMVPESFMETKQLYGILIISQSANV